jgi:non-ribosomal peptide synthetase component F
MTDKIDGLPDWFAPLCSEVEAELRRLEEGGQDRRPALQAEAADVRSMIEGWMQSMGNPDLPASVRQDIELRYGEAKARLCRIEADLAGQDGHAERRARLLDPRAALERLGRLADVLVSGNVTLGNLELGRHIDRIDAFADGSVVMRTTKLGVFEGAAPLLARPDVPASRSTTSRTTAVRERRRPRLRVNPEDSGVADSFKDDQAALDPRRFAGLDAHWFWEDPLETPKPSFWSADNAAEVARVRRENPGWTVERLCRHFGKTPPTIRKALKIAAEQFAGAAGQDGEGDKDGSASHPDQHET